MRSRADLILNSLHVKVKQKDYIKGIVHGHWSVLFWLKRCSDDWWNLAELRRLESESALLEVFLDEDVGDSVEHELSEHVNTKMAT